MIPNHIQFFSERERIYALYHTGKINEAEAAKRLRALEDPPAQSGWTLIAVLGAVVLAVVLMAVRA